MMAGRRQVEQGLAERAPEPAEVEVGHDDLEVEPERAVEAQPVEEAVGEAPRLYVDAVALHRENGEAVVIEYPLPVNDQERAAHAFDLATRRSCSVGAGLPAPGRLSRGHLRSVQARRRHRGHEGGTARDTSALVSLGGPPGTRTQNQRIKSPMLFH